MINEWGSDKLVKNISYREPLDDEAGNRIPTNRFLVKVVKNQLLALSDSIMFPAVAEKQCLQRTSFRQDITFKPRGQNGRH